MRGQGPGGWKDLNLFTRILVPFNYYYNVGEGVMHGS